MPHSCDVDKEMNACEGMNQFIQMAARQLKATLFCWRVAGRL